MVGFTCDSWGVFFQYCFDPYIVGAFSHLLKLKEEIVWIAMRFGPTPEPVKMGN